VNIPAPVVLAIAAFSAAITWLAKPELTPVTPFTADDARGVIAKLRPISGGGVTDVGVWLFANGDVNIDVSLEKYGAGSKMTGRGRDLPSAVADLARKSNLISDALK
jgi:hypothetical protein